MEKLIYVTVFTTWIIVKIEKGSLFLSFGAFSTVLGTLIVVCVNEYILDKVLLIIGQLKAQIFLIFFAIQV